MFLYVPRPRRPPGWLAATISAEGEDGLDKSQRQGSPGLFSYSKAEHKLGGICYEAAHRRHQGHRVRRGGYPTRVPPALRWSSTAADPPPVRLRLMEADVKGH